MKPAGKSGTIIRRLFRFEHIMLVFLLSLIAFSLSLIPFRFGMEIDEGIWNYIARMWHLYGLAPYTDLVENKPPGIFYVFYISNILFGLNLWFPRLLAVLSLTATSGVLYLLGKSLHNKTTGLFAMMFFGMCMSSYVVGAYTVSTESFMVFFSTLSFLWVAYANHQQVYWRYVACILLAGISIGCALAFKQIALADMGALFWFYCLYGWKRSSPHRKFFRDMLLAFGGVFLATVLSLIPVLAGGSSFASYIECVWKLILFSGTVHPETVTVKKSFKVWAQSEMVFWYVALYWFIVKSKLFRIHGIPVISILVWTAAAFVAVNSAGTFWWHHQQQVIAPMSLVIALTLGIFVENFSLTVAARRKVVLLFLILMIVVFMPFPSIADYAHNQALFYDNNPRTVGKKEVGLWVKENTNIDDTVYVYETIGPVVLAYADRRPASRLFSRMFFHNEEYVREFMRDVRSDPPRYLLIRSGTFFSKGFKHFISEEYKISEKKFGYNIFEHK